MTQNIGKLALNMKNNVFLYIETKEVDKFYLSLFINGEIYDHEYIVDRGKMSTCLLKEIDILLKKNNLNIKDLNLIGVFAGPGSYTSLRIGVVTANTMAWGLNVPIIAISGKKSQKDIIEAFKKNTEKHFFKPVDVYYQQ